MPVFGQQSSIIFLGPSCVSSCRDLTFQENEGQAERQMRMFQKSLRFGQAMLVGLAGCGIAGLVLLMFAGLGRPDEPGGKASPELRAELKSYRHKIVYETNRDGNWELYLVNADGSDPVNLTRTPDVDELYPKPSPDGSKICFVADEGKGAAKTRNLYYVNSDGSGRTKVADNAREPCWNPDGTAIAYMKGEFEKHTFSDFATKGLFIYDLQTGKTRSHPNDKLHHLYTLNWSPDGNWFVATVHGGMGFSHGIIAIEAKGDKVYDLKLEGCRPNLTPDGKRIAWGHGDFCAGVADLDLTGPAPKATNIHNVVESKDPIETYHVNWSPDQKYLTYTRGPKNKRRRLDGLLPEFPGVEAPGWDVCVADATQKNRWIPITTDGKSCKQPSWVVVREGAAR
jgi:Tol biopolymer transport system component